ncbi:MAG TPA: hypothetical protein VIX63_09435 [Vicinamibacterales bacterium]
MRVPQILLVMAAAVAIGTPGVSAQTIPTEFRDLHDELYASLDSFRTTLAQSWDGSRAPVAFSAELMSAHSARGPALLAPGLADSLEVEIDNLKALGVRAITIHVCFPMLYRPFHGSEAEYQQYLAFYVRVAQAIRARGLTLVVATQTIFSEDGFSPWDVGSYYASLPLPEYQHGRMEVARTLALALQPDYLSVITEPDTEASQAGKPELGTLEGSRALLDVILTGLREYPLPGVAIGAGVGTWQRDYRQFVESYAASSIDFVDMHVYPIGGEFLERAVEIAEIAASAGKQVGMTETWLYKLARKEQGLLPFPAILKRDSFGFWAPLDSLHLRTMVALAHFKRFAFMSPFWAGYLRGYVDFNDVTKNLTWPELDQLAQATWSENLRAGVYSMAGAAYRDALLVPADVTPPAAPDDVASPLTSPNSVVLTWSPSSDDVGTSAYRVFRDGELMTQTALLHFADADLAEARPFVYSVVALDASGNVSTPASVVARTPDVTPPSAPLNFAAIATRAQNQIDIALSWAPSSDNVGVAQYRLTRGASPDSLSAIAGPETNSFTLVNVRPETTYYFGVSSIDTSGNVSSQVVVSVTTPSLPDVTPPVVKVVHPDEGAIIVFRRFQVYALTYDTMGGLYDVPSGPAGVRFFVDGVPVGDAQTVPQHEGRRYSVFKLEIAAPLSPGEHRLTAVARDLAGNVAASEPIRIIVLP